MNQKKNSNEDVSWNKLVLNQFAFVVDFWAVL